MLNTQQLNLRYSDPIREPIQGNVALESKHLIQPKIREWLVCGRVYRVSSLELPQRGDIRDSRIVNDVNSHRYDPAIDGEMTSSPVDINWCLNVINHDQSPFVYGKDIFRFRGLDSGPIMVMWKNSHRWDSSEFIVPRREDLILELHRQGLEQPWLIFSQHRLFPATPRIPGSEIGNVLETGKYYSLSLKVIDLLKSAMAEETSIEFSGELHEELSEYGRKYRYMVLEITREVIQKHRLHRIAGIVNMLFFEYGIVLLRRKDPSAGTPPYQGNHGELHHDIKLLVDRAAPFSEGQFTTGWGAYIQANDPWNYTSPEDIARSWLRPQAAL